VVSGFDFSLVCIREKIRAERESAWQKDSDGFLGLAEIKVVLEKELRWKTGWIQVCMSFSKMTT